LQDVKRARQPLEKGAAPEEPSSSQVWGALARIEKSPTMRRAQKLIQLLNFLVETTLAGNAHYLKETTIGVYVFGRSPDYDPKSDTIVRSQAWRLRAKLKEYYASEGAQDRVLIDIAKGQYSASFSLRPVPTVDPSAISTGGHTSGPLR
jgi:hypothetical protein